VSASGLTFALAELATLINSVINDCLVDAGSDVNQTSPQLIYIS